MKGGVLLGDMLFPSHEGLGLKNGAPVFMKESVELCTHFRYHKQKILLFLSAMRSHAETLADYDLTYEQLDDTPYTDALKKWVLENKITEIMTYEIQDKFFAKTLQEFCEKHEIILTEKDSPAFLLSEKDIQEYQENYSRLFHNDFYIWQRKRMNVMLANGEPEGRQWSFDEDNRKKLPKSVEVPKLPVHTPTKHEEDVKTIIEKRFGNHPGTLDEFIWPTTREDALAWMKSFFDTRFSQFGPYEDAIDSDETFIFHSTLSPLINCGLLTPQEVLEEALKHDVPINSKEGFVRQLIGWREFIRVVYQTEDVRGNHFEHKRKLGRQWYTGDTGIPILDRAITRAQKYGWTHHIERLMVIGNIMLLSEIDPDEVYKWFMEMYVDSADWVMEPNVYGMSQFADGGVFATKPYICGSNYLRKMSDEPKGEWCDIVDGLYWSFIEKNKETFAKNHRMSMMVRMLDRLSDEKKKRIFSAAEEFKKRVTKNY